MIIVRKLILTSIVSFLCLMITSVVIFLLNPIFRSYPIEHIIFLTFFWGTQIISVIFHELGHVIQIMQYAKMKVKFEIEVIGIYGFTRSEYFNILEQEAKNNYAEYCKNIKRIAISGPLFQAIFLIPAFIVGLYKVLKIQKTLYVIIETQDILFIAITIATALGIGMCILQLIDKNDGDWKHFKNPQAFKYQLPNRKKYKKQITGLFIIVVGVVGLTYLFTYNYNVRRL